MRSSTSPGTRRYLASPGTVRYLASLTTGRIAASLRLLFLEPAYLILSLLLTVVLFIVYFVANNLAVFTSIFSISRSPLLLWKVFTNQVEMVWNLSGPINILAVGAVALLAGVVLSLNVFRIRRTGLLAGRHSFAGFLGVFGGMFGAACAACQTALISLVVGAGGLALFPFKGLELSLLALALLSLSLYLLSKSLAELGLVEKKP